MIGRRNREIAFLVARPVAEIVVLAPGVPAAFFGIDEVEPGVLVLIEADVVEDEELGFGAEERGVGETGVLAGTIRPSSRSSADRDRSAGG